MFAGLTAPIFHGGTLKAQKRGAEADARGCGRNLRQTVTRSVRPGFRPALGARATTPGRWRPSSEAADVAGRSLHLSRRSFEVGNSGILQVLEANRT